MGAIPEVVETGSRAVLEGLPLLNGNTGIWGILGVEDYRDLCVSFADSFLQYKYSLTGPVVTAG
jgi:hypothetical protein